MLPTLCVTFDLTVENVGGKLTKVPGISQGVSIFSDYRKFLDRGNVIDLAVAVVIGTMSSIAPVWFVKMDISTNLTPFLDFLSRCTTGAAFTGVSESLKT